MATLYGIGDTWSNVDHWSASSGGGSASAIPANGDVVYLDGNSIPMTLDVADAPAGGALGELNMTAYTNTLDMNSNTIDVDGPVQLGGTIAGPGTFECGDNFDLTVGMTNLPATLDIILNTSGTSDVLLNGVAGGKYTINASGTHILQDTLSLVGLTYVAGTFTDDGNSIQHVGNIAWNTVGNLLTNLTLAYDGGTSTLTNAVRATGVATGGGTVTLGNFNLYVHYVADSWSDNPSTTFTAGVGVVIFRMTGVRAQAGDVTIKGGVLLQVSGTAAGDTTLTIAGDLDIDESTLNISGSIAGRDGSLNVGGNLTCGEIELGASTVNDRNGILTLSSGSHLIGDIAAAKVDDSDNNTLNLGSAFITLRSGATVNANRIDITNIACQVYGGTVLKVTTGSAEKVHCHDTVDGGDNDPNYIDFDEYALGLQTMMGIG